MRWEKDPVRLTGLLLATSRPPLWRRAARLLVPLLVGLVCVLLVSAPLLFR